MLVWDLYRLDGLTTNSEEEEEEEEEEEAAAAEAEAEAALWDSKQRQLITRYAL